MGKGRSTASDLIGDLIENILVRLPVRSLLRFRCVSRSWCCLIDSKEFINSHLAISKLNSQDSAFALAHGCLLVVDLCFRFDIVQYSLTRPIKKTDDFILHSLPENARAMDIVGCCNGLLCIGVYTCLGMNGHFMLWNPSTRKFKFVLANARTFNGPSYGFGFDESKDDYKIVLPWTDGYDLYFTYVRVYSLRSQCWKAVHPKDEDEDIGHLSSGQGVFWRGRIYWFRKTSDDLDNDFSVSLELVINIVSFDLSAEAWAASIELPRGYDYERGSSIDAKMGVFGESLCLICEKPDSDIDIWVLKPDQQQQACWGWEKSFKIPGCELKILRPISSKLFVIYNDPDDNAVVKSLILGESDLGGMMNAEILLEESLVPLPP